MDSGYNRDRINLQSYKNVTEQKIYFLFHFLLHFDIFVL